MAIDSVRAFLAQHDLDDQIREFPVSSATVALAAQALGCEEARIAKTLSFLKGDHALLVVTAGDVKIDNSKFKHAFGLKAKMLSPEQVVELVGHAVGGVCPFAVCPTAEIYLDRSLQRFSTVFPACGSANSAIALTPKQLGLLTGDAWVDVCKAAI